MLLRVIVYSITSFIWFILTNLECLYLTILEAMKSQLEWSHKKFIKFEMKKGRSRKENKEFLKQGFPNSIEKCREGLEILLGEILAIQWFCHFADKIL